MKTFARTTLICVLFSIQILAQPVGIDDLFVRVVDVGAGRCCAVKMPGGYYMVYDAGRGSTSPFKAILEIIPEDEEIDPMLRGNGPESLSRRRQGQD